MATRQCTERRTPFAPLADSLVIAISYSSPRSPLAGIASGPISQFKFKQVIVGDSVNAQGGTAWLREQGIDIVDLNSPECIAMIGKFQQDHPELWNECIGEG